MELINRFLKAGKKLYYCGSATVYIPLKITVYFLFYIGKWFYGLGPYRIVLLIRSQRASTKMFTPFFTVPRYLIRRIPLMDARLIIL